MSIPEAPLDGETYGRKIGQWIKAYDRNTLDLFVNEVRSLRAACGLVYDQCIEKYDAMVALYDDMMGRMAEFLRDAPQDGTLYARKDGQWEEVAVGQTENSGRGLSVSFQRFINPTTSLQLPSNDTSVLIIPPATLSSSDELTIVLPPLTGPGMVLLTFSPEWTTDSTGQFVNNIVITTHPSAPESEYILYTSGSGNRAPLRYNIPYRALYADGYWVIADAGIAVEEVEAATSAVGIGDIIYTTNNVAVFDDGKSHYVYNMENKGTFEVEIIVDPELVTATLPACEMIQLPYDPEIETLHMAAWVSINSSGWGFTHTRGSVWHFNNTSWSEYKEWTASNVAVADKENIVAVMNIPRAGGSKLFILREYPDRNGLITISHINFTGYPQYEEHWEDEKEIYRAEESEFVLFDEMSLDNMIVTRNPTTEAMTLMHFRSRWDSATSSYVESIDTIVVPLEFTAGKKITRPVIHRAGDFILFNGYSFWQISFPYNQTVPSTWNDGHVFHLNTPVPDYIDVFYANHGGTWADPDNGPISDEVYIYTKNTVHAYGFADYVNNVIVEYGQISFTLDIGNKEIADFISNQWSDSGEYGILIIFTDATVRYFGLIDDFTKPVFCYEMKWSTPIPSGEYDSTRRFYDNWDKYGINTPWLDVSIKGIPWIHDGIKTCLMFKDVFENLEVKKLGSSATHAKLLGGPVVTRYVKPGKQ